MNHQEQKKNRAYKTLKTVKTQVRTYCSDRSIPSLQAICRNYFVYFYDDAVAMVTFNDRYRKIVCIMG